MFSRVTINASICPIPGLRMGLYKIGGVVIGADTYINMHVHMIIEYNSKATVKLGERVAVAPGVVFAAVSGGYKAKVMEYFEEINQPIIIEDDVWIGANVTILPGITIGKMSVIGAGTVVNKNVEPGSVVVGVPGKVIKTIPFNKK